MFIPELRMANPVRTEPSAASAHLHYTQRSQAPAGPRRSQTLLARKTETEILEEFGAEAGAGAGAGAEVGPGVGGSP